MKVLHVVVGLDPALGGPPAVAMRLAAAQAIHGHDIRLAGHDRPDRAAAIRQSMQAVPGIEHVKVELLDERVRFGWLVSPAARDALDQAVGASDVVHLHGLWEPMIRIAAGVARKQRKPYVLTPHGMLDPWSLKQRWMKKKIAMMVVFRRLLQNAACLHLLNEDEVRLLQPLGLHTPTTVLPNGIFIEEIEPLPQKGSFRSMHPELQDDPFVLFLSRLHYKKGLDFLADAFGEVAAVMPRVRLVVAGPDDGAQTDFEDRIKALDIEDRVHVIGPLWGRDKYAAMVDAACFCLPSRQEGFSMAITEALACELPAVISEHCHFPEVGEHGAGIVTTLDAHAIAQALRVVLDDPHSRSTMGIAGRMLVRERFTWPAIAERSIQMYESLISKA